jgi:hypothetical protein
MRVEMKIDKNTFQGQLPQNIKEVVWEYHYSHESVMK